MEELLQTWGPAQSTPPEKVGVTSKDYVTLSMADRYFDFDSPLYVG